MDIPLTSYYVTVCTSKLKGAGTSANVWIELVGDSGSTGQYQLLADTDGRKKVLQHACPCKRVCILA
jgi:hypothetical protein